jgi:hypothetical protein
MKVYVIQGGYEESGVLETIEYVRQLIRQVFELTDISDPRDIADAVGVNLTDEQWREVGVYLLPGLVREMNRAARNGGPPSRSDAMASSDPTEQGEIVTGNGKFVSPKIARVWDWWEKQCNSAAEVGGKWKTVGILTPAECDEFAASLVVRGQRTIASGHRYHRLAAGARREGVARIGDLDRATARQCWEAA